MLTAAVCEALIISARSFNTVWHKKPAQLAFASTDTASTLELARGRVKSAVSENLTKLKELLQERPVVLQDGRQVTL